MEKIEYIREAIRSVLSNRLRAVLTALIIAIGITALVGILTAISAIDNSVNSNLASLGANSFTINTENNRRGRVRKVAEPLRYHEVVQFEEMMKDEGTVAISTVVSFSAEAKYRSQKTNPNIQVIGANAAYLKQQDLRTSKGRLFTGQEMESGRYVALIGSEIAKTLFGKEDPVNKNIRVLGRSYKVVGVLESRGSDMGGGSLDRGIVIPLTNARILFTSEPTFTVTVQVYHPERFESVMAEAEMLMRRIRNDRVGAPSSFQIERNETLAEELSEITGYLSIGGGVISFITLLGAAVGLMNIMLVSVTERTREIGTRKAIGATPRQIQWQFLLEAIAICQLGGLAGIVMGLLIGNGVARLLEIDTFVVPWGAMLLGVTVCVIVGVAAGFYPSYKASRLDPIEALRYE
ncbi:MAG: ABC transporter permease [Thermonema sp.]|uniref:ABC transporter permease n=1 Tax=Thermonema sp. TaxID=2231181 RepID=UPI0021DD0E46|nr:ABC transporter permease [Thermonema sp.]GIV38312.1 MAG: ABC transporter permease [Thermonema sp.]